VVFSSDGKLVADDTNGLSDVFVRDRQTGTTERVSLGSSGNQANDGSYESYISADGLLVAFQTPATNLVADDTNGAMDVFAHELQTGTTEQPECIAPNSTASATTSSGAPYELDTWTNEEVQVILSAQDNEGGSGVKDIYYSVNGDQPTVYDPQYPPVISSEGTTTINYYATDNMGSIESPKTFTVKIDKTPPSVASTDPLNNATGVSATANVQVTFTEDGSGINPNTLTSKTFKVVQVKPTGNVAVSGTVSYEEDFKKATFDPSGSLAKGLYRATITTGVKDKAGNALSEDHTWLFATAGPSKK
jgi:hypothetical protein